MSVSHLWLGLLSSIIVFTACLSGSIYAFKNQISSLVDHHHVFVDTQNHKKANLDKIVADFNQHYGGATSVQLFSKPYRSVIVTSFSKASSGVTAYYHPQTGELLGLQNERCRHFFELILDLHRFLLLGETGKLINGIAILIFVFMLFSGLILWFPKKLKHLKQKLTIKWRARFYCFTYDLHSVLGFYAMLLLLFMSITGLYVSFHWVKNMVIVGLGGNSIVISKDNAALKQDLSNAFDDLLLNLETETNKEDLGFLSFQSLLKEAETTFPFSGNTILTLPNEFTKNTKITKLSNNNILGFYIPNTLEFTSSGQILKTVSFHELPLHEQFKAIAKPLHTGEIMGLPSIIAYFIVSLIGCSLPVTGFLMWWKRAS